MNVSDVLCLLCRWMEACLGEELPAPTELEESLRNGVLLAKLAHRFAPMVVPLKKIYDLNQQRYQVPPTPVDPDMCIDRCHKPLINNQLSI